MRKPELLRRIYAELKEGLPSNVPAADVLRLASQILRSYKAPHDYLSEFGRTIDQRSFFSLPVDEAMSDGGWEVAAFERKREPGWVDDECIIDFLDRDVRLRRFLGPDWKQVNWQGDELKICETISED